MNRQERSDKVKKDFPIGCRVEVQHGVTGTVSGYASYDLAFVGYTTFVVVENAKEILGEFGSSTLRTI